MGLFFIFFIFLSYIIYMSTTTKTERTKYMDKVNLDNRHSIANVFRSQGMKIMFYNRRQKGAAYKIDLNDHSMLDFARVCIQLGLRFSTNTNMGPMVYIPLVLVRTTTTTETSYIL